MRRSLRQRLLALAPILALAALVCGCTTAADRGTRAAVGRRAEEFATAMRDVRSEGRRGSEDILGVYAQIPAEVAPGLSAWRDQALDALARAKADGGRRLTPAEVDALTVHNPDFWRAWFEFEPRDCSLLMVHANLLLESGQLFRASLFLTGGVQAAPLNAQERMFWLVQQARAHWVLTRRLAELEVRKRDSNKDVARRETVLQAALAEWPQDGFAIEALLRSRAGLKPGSTGEDDSQPVVLTPAGRAQAEPLLARLRQVSPVVAARYAEESAASAEFGRLWEAVADEERPVEERILTKLSEQARQMAFPELALLMRRLAVARRGFYAPVDMEPTRQLLPRLLRPEEADALMKDIEQGMPGVRLTKPAEESAEVLPGMDPLVHPLYAEHAVREYGRESLWLEAVENDPRMRAEHLRQRSIRSSNVGRYDVALEDLDAALKLFPLELRWQLDRANLLAKAGRTAEAGTLFAQLNKRAPRDPEVRFSRAVFELGEGRHAEAEKLFRSPRRNDPNQPYRVIFAHLCAVRRGAPDMAWLRSNRMTGAEWPAAIQRFWLGEIDRRALLAAATDPSDLRTTERQCEAFLSLGFAALAAGDHEAAQRDLENCVQCGIVGFIEHDLAKRELARLRRDGPPGSEPAKPPADTGARKGDGDAKTRREAVG